MGLGYPGGPIIEKISKSGNRKFDFTIPMKKKTIVILALAD